MELLAHDSFKRLISQKGIRPRVYESTVKAMEAVELMATTCQLGDQVLALARRERINASRAETLLLDLIDCFLNPIERARRVIEIGRELRGHEE